MCSVNVSWKDSRKKGEGRNEEKGRKRGGRKERQVNELYPEDLEAKKGEKKGVRKKTFLASLIGGQRRPIGIQVSKHLMSICTWH